MAKDKETKEEVQKDYMELRAEKHRKNVEARKKAAEKK